MSPADADAQLDRGRGYLSLQTLSSAYGHQTYRSIFMQKKNPSGD